MRLAQTVHLSCVKVNTISKRTETSFPLHPCHLEVPSGASKLISEPMVRLAQTMHLSCVEVNTISKRTETSFPLHLCHRGVPSGASKLISERMVRLAQILHLSCIESNTFSKLNETSLHLTHVTYEFQQVRLKRLLSQLHVRFKPCNYLASRLTLSTNGLKRASP